MSEQENNRGLSNRTINVIAGIFVALIIGIISGCIHNAVKESEAEAEQKQAAQAQLKRENTAYLVRMITEYQDMEADRATRSPMDFCNASLLIVRACQDDGCSAQWAKISRRDCEIASKHYKVKQ